MVDRKFSIARRWSNQVLKKYAPYFSGSVVNVSAKLDFDRVDMNYREYFTNARSYQITNHDVYESEAQIRQNEIKLDLEEELREELIAGFDVVFNHTTLEHIFHVEKAFSNLCRLAKEAVIVVVPFSQQQHVAATYYDYWRFTPYSLERMFEDNGFTLVVTEYNDSFNGAIYLLGIGIRDDKLADYPLFTKVNLKEKRKPPGRLIGATLTEVIKHLRSRWKK